jgi:hypothetical protein
MPARIGDIVEIETCIGFAYALYTHRHNTPPRFGALLRIFDRLYKSRPEPIAQVIDNSVRFSTFFPLNAAIKRGIFEIVGNVTVPAHLQKFPTFRSGHINPKTKREENWWLWDGQREWRVGQLTKEQCQLPIRGVWNDTLLVERIEQGWRPEIDSI